MAVLGSWIALSTHTEKYKNINISIHTKKNPRRKRNPLAQQKSKDGRFCSP